MIALLIKLSSPGDFSRLSSYVGIEGKYELENDLSWSILKFNGFSKSKHTVDLYIEGDPLTRQEIIVKIKDKFGDLLSDVVNTQLRVRHTVDDLGLFVSRFIGSMP